MAEACASALGAGANQSIDRTLMPRAPLLVVIRMLVLIALAVSSALLHDYSVPLPAFCAAGEGCAKIRESTYASLAGVPTPLIGVLAFAVLYGLSLGGHEFRKRWMVPATIIGALCGLAFLAVQAFVEHTFCKLCVVVDSAAVLAAIVAVVYRQRGSQGNDGALPASWWGAAGAIAVIAPLMFASLQPAPPAPPAIVRYWVPGKINVVELSDFECPFCRLQHPDLTAALQPYDARVDFVRLTVPLQGHPHARGASRAYYCAKDQGLGEAMADSLFNAEDISQLGIRKIADEMRARGLILDAFQRCLADPHTDERVSRDYDSAQNEIRFKGLPTVWIGAQLFEGRQQPEVLRRAVQQEASGGVSWRPRISAVWLWGLLVAGFVGLAAVSLRRTNT